MLFGKPLLGELLDYSDPLTRGLVGCWLLNEGSGNKVFDLSGNNSVFDDWTNGPIWVPSSHGVAIDFEASSNQWITCNNPNISAIGTGQYTVIIWCTYESATDNGMFSFDVFDPAWYLHTDGTPRIFDGGISSGASSGVVVGGTTLQQVAYVRYSTAANGTTFYVDGVAVGTTTHNASLVKPTTMQIGASRDSSAGFEHDGIISSVRQWNRALSASEIALLYREPFRFVSGARRRRFYAFPEIAAGVVNAAGQADIITSSLAGFRRLNRPGAAQADIVTSSLAGFRRLNRPGAGAAAIVTSSLSGMTKTWNAAAQASIVTSSFAGMRRLNRPGAAQAAINIQTFAGATGGAAAITLEEIFRYRRYRDAGVFRRRNLKGVY